jgi:hypothetical protein
MQSSVILEVCFGVDLRFASIRSQFSSFAHSELEKLKAEHISHQRENSENKRMDASMLSCQPCFFVCAYGFFFAVEKIELEERVASALGLLFLPTCMPFFFDNTTLIHSLFSSQLKFAS